MMYEGAVQQDSDQVLMIAVWNRKIEGQNYTAAG